MKKAKIKAGMKKAKIKAKPNFAEVAAEVAAILDSLASGEKDLDVLAMRLINNHAEIKGKNRDFYLRCAFYAGRKEFSDQLNSVKLKKKNKLQEEFEYLTESYGKQLNLLFDEMSFDELMAKAAEYRGQSLTLAKKSNDLIRFAMQKFPARAGAASQFLESAQP